MSSQHRPPAARHPSAPNTTLGRRWSRRSRTVPAIAFLVGALLVGGCTAVVGGEPGSSAGRPVATPQERITRPDHVMIVVFENEDYDHVVGARDAPYLTMLARKGANLTDAHAET